MHRPRLTVAALGVTAALMLLATVALGQQPATSSGLIPDGAAPDIDMLYTGDVIGFVDPCG